ncbi:ABC transporter ATP-binding protein [Aminobacter sp. LjRoot7]|uniref:ABC transporter ATP-binding protein n=1 Tax=Aminobacter sp. LjRoot7 TaxID=3342335 RepID=UPI003ECF7C63
MAIVAAINQPSTVESPRGSPDGQPAAIACQGVSRNFGGLRALVDVTFQISAGEILGILGPNGAGKTTLINVLSGLYPPSAGSVHIHGEDITTLSMSDRARHGLLRTFQNTRPSTELTGNEMLRLASLSPHASAGGRAYSARELLELFALTSYADTILSDLPYGVQKMINLAAVALCRPRVLLLDEPFQGVAESEIERLSAVIRHFAGTGVAIGLVEHNVKSVMRLCDRVMVLDSGRMIFEGKGADAIRDPNVQAAYLGKRFGGN